MLGITFIRENKALVQAAIENKKTEAVDLDQILALADRRKSLRQRLDELNREKNEAASARDSERGKKIKEEAQEMQKEYDDVQKKYLALMLKLPNIPSADTPVGPDESANKVLREVGNKPEFNFKPKPHWEIGEALGIIDNETAAKVSGARFTYLKGDLVSLQYAVFNVAKKILTDVDLLKEIAETAGIKVPVAPFTPVAPPLMMRSAVMNRMDRLHPIDDRFFFEKDDLVLIGSAEHTLGPLHMDEVMKEDELPRRYFAFTPSFRREAGSYGKDTRGIMRVHQFDKIEMETFVMPENGYAEQEFLVAIQERFLQTLTLPYRVVLISTGDMGKPDHRQIDMETWMPGQDMYKETHSADYMGAYQARRLSTKVKIGSNAAEPVHMNDATFVAMGRTLAAILENFQQEDGSVSVPEALRPYFGNDVITKE